jgi:hypothetical protein
MRHVTFMTIEEIVQEIRDNDAAAVAGDRLTPQPHVRTA